MCDCKDCKDLKEAIGRSASHSFNAEMNAAKAATTVENMEKLLYQWHDEDMAKREGLEKRIHSLEGIKQKIIGIGIGIAIFLTFIFNLGAWGFTHAWDALQKALH